MNKKNNKFYLLTIALLFFAMLPFTSATCTTTTSEDGSDYMQINQSAYSTITMAEDELWSDFTFFTPRLNFTHIVYESIVGQLTGTNYTIGWIMVGDTFTSVNTTFVLKNGTATVSSTNYTLSSTDNHTFILSFRDSRYNGSLLIAQFNRTFVKNVDDLFLNSTGITGLASFSTFIQSNSPADYGDSKLFRPNPSTLYGDSINLTNWAVGWEKDTINCGTMCERTVNTLLLDVLITIFLIGILAFIGISLYNGADFKTIVYIVVGGIVLLIGLVIIKSLVAGVCVV